MCASSGFVYAASFLLVLTGLGTAGVSGYVTYLLSIQNYWSTLLIGAGYYSMILGATTAIVSGVACWAVHREDHKILRHTSMIMTALMIAALAMGIASFIWINDVSTEAGSIVEGMDLTNLHSVESHFRCCGKVNIEMYEQSWYSGGYDIPASCCSAAVSTLCDGEHYYATGCIIKAKNYAVVLTFKMGLILCLGLLPAITILQCCGSSLAKRFRKMNTRTTSNDSSPMLASNDV